MHALLVALTLLGQTDREADMFGEEAPAAETPPTTTTTTTTPSGDREADLFGSETPETLKPGILSDSRLIDDADDALTLGGQLFLRFNGSFREGEAIGDAPLNGASLLDAFADVRPSDRIRGYAQLRFNFDYTVDEGELNEFGQPLESFSLQLAQVWAKFDLGRVAYVTAGRQRIRWGTGRFWNPSDFINQEIRNSVDFFDQRVGVDMLKVHFPFEALGWNLYLISSFAGVDVLSDTALSARAEMLFGELELALSSSVKKDAPLRFGADVSAGIWIFDVRGEAALSRGLGRKLFTGKLDFENGVLPEELDPDDDDWWFQGVAGLEASFNYTDQDSFTVGAEYFFNQAGYESAELYPFLFLNNGFVPLYTGAHYAAVYAFAQNPFDVKDMSFTVSTLANLSDASFLSRVDVQYGLLQYLTINAFVAGHWGSIGEFKLGLDVPAIPPLLPDGFVLPTQVIDVGVAARMSF
ncbi:MAG: hypothetical protein Q8O67_18065 [Deltaproteobacteria bacterium]|nr:hypothetical protein [Deltaproteobacteria bacterium]